MGVSTISLGLGLGGGKSATSSGSPGGGGGGTPFENDFSLSFDGSDDYLSIPHDTSLNLNTGLTLSAWVYWNGLSGYPIIFSKRSGAEQAYQLYQNANKLYFNNGTAVSSNTTISTGQWYHVAVTCTSGGTVIFYLNGSADGGGSAAGSIPTSTHALEIGGMSWVANRHDGLIDEASVFNSVLSASNITSIYNSGMPNDISSLSPVGWWRMGDGGTWDGTNWTIPDASTNSNTGTTANMVEASRVTTVPS